MSEDMERVFGDMKALINAQLAQLDEERQRLVGVLTAMTNGATGLPAPSAASLRGVDKVQGKVAKGQREALQSPVILSKRVMSPEARKRLSRKMKAIWRERQGASR